MRTQEVDLKSLFNRKAEWIGTNDSRVLKSIKPTQKCLEAFVGSVGILEKRTENER